MTTVPASPADLAGSEPTAAPPEQPWGRVDEAGVVYVRDGDGERQVGEYPDATPEEALAYYGRKYADLAAQVGLLEQRARRGAPSADIARAVDRLTMTLETANAVGDLGALRDRVAALTGTVSDLSAKQSEEHRAEVEAARADREAIVAEIEALAARDPATVQWKATTASVEALFARWQDSQRASARIPKGEANELWRRFRAARATIDTQRRAFFAQQDATQKDARQLRAGRASRSGPSRTGCAASSSTSRRSSRTTGGARTPRRRRAPRGSPGS